jgi:hypothetical protein
MFKRWFEHRGEMPYAVDRACGQIDRMIRLTFGCHIDDMDTQKVIASDDLFAKLCRVIMLTEIRGMRQVDILLEPRLRPVRPGADEDLPGGRARRALALAAL